MIKKEVPHVTRSISARVESRRPTYYDTASPVLVNSIEAKPFSLNCLVIRWNYTKESGVCRSIYQSMIACVRSVKTHKDIREKTEIQPGGA
ncbi:hypothetical protein TNCV_4356961 [Trichonephila clavipes]|nr:hypothetical protein TNCV_4356961 [Trichonephila clavipes]